LLFLKIILLQVHIALDLFEEMCKAGLEISAKTFHPIMLASEKRNELDLVRTVDFKLKHNVKTEYYLLHVNIIF
jgi:hypothetical protein